MSSVVWVAEPSLTILRERLGANRLAPFRPETVVTNVKEFQAATRDPSTVAFLDKTTIPQVAALDNITLPVPVIGVCDEPLQTAIGWLQPYPWISHVISTAMLQHPFVEEHLENVLRTLASPKDPRLLDWLGPSVSGRRIRLTHSSRREQRIERMSAFFDEKGVGARTLAQLRDAAEELLTNAFYDAPVTAGAFKKAVSRTQEIALPDDSACDLAYGFRDDLAIVRVRDPFGSLSRRRLVEVLSRCARTGTVEVDETMGGAGLGMWRIFSGASFVGVSVIKNRHTEVMVGITKKAGPGPKPFAFHFFFKDSGKPRFWKLADQDTTKASVNKSVMIVAKTK